MRIEIVAVGRLKSGGPERDLIDRYLGRARSGGKALGLTGFKIAEIPDGRSADAEADALVARIPAGGRCVLLDETGRACSSEAFAGTLGSWRDDGIPAAAFLIGGPDGHGKAARARADLTLSFGAMTWPHQFVRAMLAEQLYRAVTILSGHPYHRS